MPNIGSHYETIRESQGSEQVMRNILLDTNSGATISAQGIRKEPIKASLRHARNRTTIGLTEHEQIREQSSSALLQVPAQSGRKTNKFKLQMTNTSGQNNGTGRDGRNNSVNRTVMSVKKDL